MIRDRLERIRERAYHLWEKAGGGHGRDGEHWDAASKDVDDEDASAPAKPRKTKTKTKPATSAGKATEPPSAPPTKKRAAATERSRPVAKGSTEDSVPPSAKRSQAGKTRQVAKSKPGSGAVAAKPTVARKTPAKT